MAGAVAPGREHYEHLVAEFGRGWETGIPGAMSEVFTPEGVLLPSPFDEPVRGRQAIAQYWRDVPLEQAEISFRFGEILVAGPWFATEFKCTFRRIKTGEWIEVSGAMFCECRSEKEATNSDSARASSSERHEAAAEKISEMRMYWHRVVKAR